MHCQSGSTRSPEAGRPQAPEAAPGVGVVTGITGNIGPAGACASCTGLQAGSVCCAPSTAALPMAPWRHSMLLPSTLLQPCTHTLTSKAVYHAALAPSRMAHSSLLAERMRWPSGQRLASAPSRRIAVQTLQSLRHKQQEWLVPPADVGGGVQARFRQNDDLPGAVCSQDSKQAGSQLAQQRGCTGTAGGPNKHSQHKTASHSW